MMLLVLVAWTDTCWRAQRTKDEGVQRGKITRVVVKKRRSSSRSKKGIFFLVQRMFVAMSLVGVWGQALVAMCVCVCLLACLCCRARWAAEE